MTRELFTQALARYLLGILSLALLIFLPAGTLNYPCAWLLMGIVFIPMLIAGVALLLLNPELLRKRLNVREAQAEQRTVVALSGCMFIACFVLAGLDFRFGWLPLPGWVCAAASAVFLLACLLYCEVLRENAYLSRTVEIQEGQTVVDTGLYGVVRHPMYSATVILFLSIPLILGSLIALLPLLAYPAIIAMRITNEEQVLCAGLDGYDEYRSRVRWRMLPFVW